MGDNTKISRWLYGTLDYIGVSQSMRGHYQKYSRTMEVLQNILINEYQPFVMFGSTSEGTTSPEMDSDVDLVYFHNKENLFERLEDCFDSDRSILMINDSPGYVRLQLVIGRKAATKSDWNKVPFEFRPFLQEDMFGRIILGGNTFCYSMMELHASAIRRGPALTTEHSSVISTDIIHAHRCIFWPNVANEWITRNRPFGWPNPSVIKELKKGGFVLVYVDHPKSEEKDLECRISFSFQERQLMYGLNETQYKCYVFLKMVKKDLIKSVVGDSITSYHLKTCLFYTIETHSQDIWRPENLWICILKCINLLLQWVCDEFCPNYFIPMENMFVGKVEGDISERVKVILRQLVHDGPGFLERITTDNIGKYFSNQEDNLETKILVENSKLMINRAVLQTKSMIGDELLNIYFKILDEFRSEYRRHGEPHLPSMNYEKTYRVKTKHRDFLKMLNEKITITDHTVEETQMALNILKPFLRTSLACHYASLALQTEDEIKKKQYLAKSDKQFELGLLSDLTSSRLKYATVLYRLGEYQRCEEQLYLAEKQCNNFKIVSKPNALRFHTRQKEVFTTKNIYKENQLSVDLKDCLSFPVIFLPTERVIVSGGLIFEMFRSCAAPENARSEGRYFWPWYDWAMLDSRSYLYYLWDLLNRTTRRSYATCIKNICKLYDNLNTKWSEFHKETVNNLISWILVSENKIPQAFDALKFSVYEMEEVKKRNDKVLFKCHVQHYNAAKWHILLLLFKLWEQKGHAKDCVENLCYNCLNLNNCELKSCVKCKKAKYCSKECQKKDWILHKITCKR